MKDSGTRIRRRAVECANGFVVATTLPVGEQYATPFGLSEIVAEVARSPKPLLVSNQRNDAGLFPIVEGTNHD